MPAGGGVAASGTQALRLSVGEAVMARHGEGGSGADVQVLVLQGIPDIVVVLAGRGDLDAGAQGQACRPGVVQVVSGLLVLISRENLCDVVVDVGGAAGLESVRRGLLQGVRLLRLRIEDFVRCEVGVICRGGKRGNRYKPHVCKSSVLQIYFPFSNTAMFLNHFNTTSPVDKDLVILTFERKTHTLFS